MPESDRTKLQQLFTGDLPGIREHLKMTPYRALTKAVPAKRREGAVLLLLFQRNGEWYFPLMQRHDYEGVHANQISFPGGKSEKEDTSKYETALRETKEEIGIEPHKIEWIGELSEIYIPPSNFLVSAFVGCYTEEPFFVKEEKEVKEIIEVRVSDLLKPEIVKETQVTVQGGLKLKTPFLELNNQVVWGATAAILAEFKALVLAQNELFR